VKSGKQSQERSRLLIVEDDEAQLRTLTAIMRAEGFEVTGCSTASEALKHLERGGFAVAVVDLRLPDLPEEQLLARLRAVADDIRVVINTGYDSYESARDAVNLGAFAYVEKAGDPDEIVRHVHRAFHARLRRYAEDLESAVAEQTRELQEANETLRLEIADRKRAEDQVKAHRQRLRSLGAKLAVVEEQERRRIAAGLHDNVLQNLALVVMKLDGLARQKPASCLAPVLREAGDLVAQSIHDMRTLLFDLSPVALYELGFDPAVESLLDRIQGAHGLATSFRTDDLPKPMTNDVRVVLFRGVREVLQNVVKHAQALSVGVSVGRDGETVLVEVQDDGVGFDTKKALSIRDAGGGFGLFDVRERLDYLGGSLTIQSEPGKGTTVALRVPLVPEKACPGGMSQGDSSASG
ncbi:MAG: response regulator, partial [Planctomycetota bacterium]|nr:response regulator [Planctomycetota bacterium]